MKIGIVGLGVVGSAVSDGFKQIGHNIIGYDIAKPNTKLEDLMIADIIFICVPTPSRQDGSCDISNVESVIQNLSSLGYHGVIAIKSTVIPGTTQSLIDRFPNLNIGFVPEFLREKSALSDFINQNNTLIVGTHDDKCYDALVACHGPIIGKSIKITPTAAEISKYFSNLYNALRIVFANGIWEVCEKLGADYQQVYASIINLPNVGTGAYLRCGQDYRGFGGACLPKDSMAFAHLVKELRLDDIKLFQTIIDDNKLYTEK